MYDIIRVACTVKLFLLYMFLINLIVIKSVCLLLYAHTYERGCVKIFAFTFPKCVWV